MSLRVPTFVVRPGEDLINPPWTVSLSYPSFCSSLLPFTTLASCQGQTPPRPGVCLHPALPLFGLHPRLRYQALIQQQHRGSLRQAVPSLPSSWRPNAHHDIRTLRTQSHPQMIPRLQLSPSSLPRPVLRVSFA